MRDITVARNYAEALFELAARGDRQESYGEALEEFARLVDEDGRAKVFLETPRIDAESKKTVLRSALGDRMPREVVNFLQVLIDKRRQRLLRSISWCYQELLDELLGRTHVQVTVARQFSDEAMGALSEKLSTMLGKQAVTHIRVKPEVLGGVMLRSGNTVYDGTLRRKLDGIRRALLSVQLPDAEPPKEPAPTG